MGTGSSFVMYPHYWTPVYKNLYKEELSPTSDEFKYCKALFPDSADIKTIIRIQNKKLWKRYAIARSLVEEKTKTSEEVFLLHGTKECNVKSICEKGFKVSKCEKGLFGVGCYFTNAYSMAMYYTDMYPASEKFIFVVRILSYENNKDAILCSQSSEGNIILVKDESIVCPEYLVCFNNDKSNICHVNASVNTKCTFIVVYHYFNTVTQFQHTQL